MVLRNTGLFRVRGSTSVTCRCNVIRTRGRIGFSLPLFSRVSPRLGFRRLGENRINQNRHRSHDAIDRRSLATYSSSDMRVHGQRTISMASRAPAGVLLLTRPESPASRSQAVGLLNGLCQASIASCSGKVHRVALGNRSRPGAWLIIARLRQLPIAFRGRGRPKSSFSALCVRSVNHSTSTLNAASISATVWRVTSMVSVKRGERSSGATACFHASRFAATSSPAADSSASAD